MLLVYLADWKAIDLGRQISGGLEAVELGAILATVRVSLGEVA
jgi:hypothetical protein